MQKVRDYFKSGLKNLKGEKNVLLLFLSVTAILVIGRYFEDKRKEELLKGNTKETWAIYVEETRGRGYHHHYKFYNSKKEAIKFGYKGYKYIEIGDTVWIKYSLEDNEVAKVIEPYCTVKQKAELKERRNYKDYY